MFLEVIGDLFLDIFRPGDPASKRERSLRRKLVRYIKYAPSSAYYGSAAEYLNEKGEIQRNARAKVLSICKKFDTKKASEWEMLCSEFLNSAQREMPGISVQLPPDEPRMVYAGDKQL